MKIFNRLKIQAEETAKRDCRNYEGFGQDVEVGIHFDLNKMNMDDLLQIEELLAKNGIHFDKGTGSGERDWEWDWSLEGPVHITFRQFKDDSLNRYKTQSVFTSLKVEADYAKEVAETILNQMGGYGKLKAMIGIDQIAYNQAPGGMYELVFHFKGCPKYKFCKVLYNKGKDLYDLQLWKNSYKDKKEFENIFNHDLKPLFEKTTGLRLSL